MRAAGRRLSRDRRTDSLIARFLGESNATKPNPHNRSGPPMRFYLLARIEEMPVTVRRMSALHALKLAIRSYNERHEALSWGRPGRDFSCAHEKSDPAFLTRIQVNYLRYHQTRYDRALEEVAGKIGVHEAARAIKRWVLRAIAAAYLYLANKCLQQMPPSEAIEGKVSGAR